MKLTKFLKLRKLLFLTDTIIRNCGGPRRVPCNAHSTQQVRLRETRRGQIPRNGHFYPFLLIETKHKSLITIHYIC